MVIGSPHEASIDNRQQPFHRAYYRVYYFDRAVIYCGNRYASKAKNRFSIPLAPFAARSSPERLSVAGLGPQSAQTQGHVAWPE
eukprot:scaffold624854_cov48-Prasinocladus_malaysianus.AAC.1